MYKRPALRNGTKIPQAAPISESANYWGVKIENLIKTGKLVHIDTDDIGRPVYRLKDAGS
jgi:hypothetical protein